MKENDEWTFGQKRGTKIFLIIFTKANISNKSRLINSRQTLILVLGKNRTQYYVLIEI